MHACCAQMNERFDSRIIYAPGFHINYGGGKISVRILHVEIIEDQYLLPDFESFLLSLHYFQRSFEICEFISLNCRQIVCLIEELQVIEVNKADYFSVVDPVNLVRVIFLQNKVLICQPN